MTVSVSQQEKYDKAGKSTGVALLWNPQSWNDWGEGSTRLTRLTPVFATWHPAGGLIRFQELFKSYFTT